ncbi:MAG: hypothetical protein CVU62_11665 [Deltaproteobacteria bacterium HGW-Deltaproteobacteria-2]|jgi:hypothetical protein|nr:MAG: hypothetical protein CVU62_11665 [Deltaproteobacteria bacterium HGW-Deltaproteobacteria-2]
MIEMQKKQTTIICTDGTSIKCSINVLPGQKLFDIIKSTNEAFVLINDVEINYQEQMQSFKLSTKITEKKDSLILNKSIIKWIDEIK